MNVAVLAPLSEHQAQKMETLGRFASGIVHDFNSVLAAIGVYADMLARLAHDAKQKQCAERMVAATERGRHLVGQLLAYVRSESSTLVATDVSRSASAAADLAQALAAGIAIETNISREPLIVLADPTQLEQVVMNLCTNAIHAMPSGGTLRVNLSRAEVPVHVALSHGSLAPGHYAMLRVEDDGCGMDAATLSRAFEPFFTTRGLGHGTGLGLAIVKTMVERFGGAIDVRTAPGAGTCFSIYVPLAHGSHEGSMPRLIAPMRMPASTESIDRDHGAMARAGRAARRSAHRTSRSRPCQRTPFASLPAC